MADLQSWWNSLPIVTKWLFALSMGLSLTGNFGLFNPMQLLLVWPRIYRDFEIWRLVTNFFFHPLGFGFLIHMLFLVRYGQFLEMTTFAGRTADYVFFLLFGNTILLVLSYFLNLRLLGVAMITMIIYLWSRKNPNITMSIMFGIQFQSFYFPWVLCALSVLMGGFPLGELTGIFVGHIYYFLDEIYPATGGQRWLKTPQILYQWFPPAFTYGGPQGAPQQPQGHQWGTGRPLGGN